MTATALSKTPPKDLAGKYALRGSYRLACSTGLVTTVAAGTATAGQLFVMRWSSSTSTKMYLKRVGARFTCTTAYGTAQRTGCDMILARSFSANASGGTAIDVGSTVADTGNLDAGFATSLIVANATRVATTAELTAGTHTLDANEVGTLIDWTGAIGDQVPRSTSGAAGNYGLLWDYRASSHGLPIKFTQNEGFVIRNKVLMGATGVGVWDFLVEWDEGVPET
jgi:hypothetical protein